MRIILSTCIWKGVIVAVRRDSKGRVFRKGESYKKSKQLYVYSYTDSLGKRRYEYSKDLMTLREKEENITRNSLDKLDLYCVGKADINYVFDRYMSIKNNIRGTTKSNYLFTYDRYVRNGFGKKRISDVKYSDVVLFYNSILDSGLTISTVDNIHSLLHPTFTLAVKDNILRNNPSDGALAEIKKCRKKSEKRRALTYEQERAFLDYLDRDENTFWKPIFTFMLGTGVRVGEVIGLRWCDVDFDSGIININHSVSYYQKNDKDHKCGYEVSVPKTEAGIRDIPMLDLVCEALLEEKNNQEVYGYHNIVEIDGMSGFIFCNRFGNLHKSSSLNRAIKRIVDDYNSSEEIKAKREHRDPLLIPRFSCHVMRHTFCTRLCENETNIKVIQDVMGHKDIQTTMDIYAEVSEQKKRDVFNNLNHENVL